MMIERSLEGGEKNKRESKGSSGSHGQGVHRCFGPTTYFYSACKKDHLDVVNALLSIDGIDVNRNIWWGSTPLCVQKGPWIL